MFYSYHKRAREAVPLLQRAAAISEKFDDRVYHAIDLDNLATAYHNLKQYQQASELQLRALKVANELSFGEFLARTKGTILYNLGTSYIEVGRNKEAEECFKQSITVLTSGGSEVEPWRLKTAKNSYAELLRKTGRAREAQELEAPALQPGTPADPPRPGGAGGR
jgi:tetratricopeptide (TPR) repeat protein